MNNKFKPLILLFLSIALFSCGKKKVVEANYNTVPLPQKIKITEGSPFLLSNSTKIVYTSGDETMKQTAQFLSDYIKASTGIILEITDKAQESDAIILQDGLENSNLEAYQISVSESKVIIRGASHSGIFYGAQTLRKSIPAGDNISDIHLSPVEINDYPRFGYRGMHLDVGRHMFSADDIKTYIDMLALHNINRFHWHLTEDQGWRIEIKKYPELIEKGSMREQTVIGKNSGEYDGKPYGGYYTQEEVKDIVKYAHERFITIIPEVDLPGHMLAALTAYPNLGCTGGPYKVAQTWGIFDEVLCAGNEEIYTFLEGVFDEVLELFPSEYIHVGGDECPKGAWEKCPKCQAKIKELGLKDDSHHTAEQKLQSYVIQRMEKYLNSKGRKVIGWDEILEGGVAPNATIMSWQGTEGGIAAARQHHDAIMVPSAYLYFDYYQSLDTKNEPFAIGGFVSVEKVYNYEPVPSELTEDEKKFIIGVQANIWTEYIKDFNHVQYMALPRMGALSEIQWTMPEKKNYTEFLPRLVNLTKLYSKLGYNYAKHIFDLAEDIKVDNEKRQITVSLSTVDNAPIYFTLDGSDPNESSQLYQGPIVIEKDALIKAVAIRDGGGRSSLFEREFKINKATFKAISLANQPWDKYTYAGAPTLVNGQEGGSAFASGGWIGFGGDFIATVDLAEPTSISSVTIGSLVDMPSWIFNASEYTVEISDDNKNFKQVFTKKYDPAPKDYGIATMYLKADFEATNTRYVRITAKPLSKQPEWGGGPGSSASLFIDEINIQ